MLPFWWGCRGNLKLITLGSERFRGAILIIRPFAFVPLKTQAELWAELTEDWQSRGTRSISNLKTVPNYSVWVSKPNGSFSATVAHSQGGGVPPIVTQHIQCLFKAQDRTWISRVTRLARDGTTTACSSPREQNISGRNAWGVHWETDRLHQAGRRLLACSRFSDDGKEKIAEGGGETGAGSSSAPDSPVHFSSRLYLSSSSTIRFTISYLHPSIDLAVILFILTLCAFFHLLFLFVYSFPHIIIHPFIYSFSSIHS